MEVSQQKQERAKPKPAFAIISLLMIGLLSVYFLFSAFDLYAQGSVTQSTVFFLLGIVGLVFSLIMVNRFMGASVVAPPHKKPVTIVKCTKCSFKNIREFQVGDYIPKATDACPSCGSPTFIEGIYVDEPQTKKRREENF